eukprot:scaffold238043_cov21-Tisochrysis_lutea.AAC.4
MFLNLHKDHGQGCHYTLSPHSLHIRMRAGGPRAWRPWAREGAPGAQGQEHPGRSQASDGRRGQDRERKERVG